MEKKMVCKTEVYLNRVLRTSFISQVGHSLYHHHNHRHTLIMKSRRRIITSFPKETHKNERKRGMQLRRVNWKRPTEHIFLSSLLFLDREQEWEWGWRCRWQTFKPQVWKGGFRSNLLLFSLSSISLSLSLLTSFSDSLSDQRIKATTFFFVYSFITRKGTECPSITPSSNFIPFIHIFMLHSLTFVWLKLFSFPSSSSLLRFFLFFSCHP